MNLLLERRLGCDISPEEIFGRDEEDDVTMESSTESLSLEFQMTNKYNQLLPYADELDKEALTLLAEIKAQLGRAVVLRKLEPDAAFATLKLQRYIKLYSLRFTKEDHIIFIKLIYELITIPQLEPSLVYPFGSTLLILLRKLKLLSPSDLQLDWRPLYELKKRLMEVSISSTDMHRFPTQYGKIIHNLINAAKIYFPLSATQEILDELRPGLCPTTPSMMSKTMDYLDNFLPVQLPPEHHHLGFQLWFEEMMSLWETSHTTSTWQQSIMWLIARLAYRNIGYIDWTPHIPLMFTRFIRCLHLPVYYKQTHCGKPHTMDSQSMAMWMVSILGPDSTGQFHLDKFLKTVETYCYQANVGPWVDKLKDLLSKLATHFVYRLNSERYATRSWQTPIPDSHKLTDADVDEFVSSMMPVAMTAMFGQTSVDATSTVFRLLSTIRPNLVIPHVIDRMFSTLDSLTEPHKLTAAMAAVTAVARPLIQGRRNVNVGYTYDEGPSRVIPLLMSLLPGIDSNDLLKSFATFRLISVYVTMIPIADSSRAAHNQDSNQNPGDISLDESDRQVLEDTAQFEDFILQFFERIFALIESSTLDYVSHENQENNGKSKVESIVEMALGSVCMRLLLRTSSDIYQSALHKLRVFVTERVFEPRVSGPLAASLCRSFSRVNGGETLKALLPSLAETILEFVEEGDVAKEETLDDRLLYALLIVANIMDAKGSDLIPHMDTLITIIDKTLHLKSREGARVASRILRSLLTSLSSIVVSHNFNNGRDFNDPTYPNILQWGEGSNVDDIELQWYVPGEEETAMAQKLFNRYMPIEIRKIKEYINTGNSITRQELLTSLNVVSAIIDGCISFLPVPEDDSRCPEQEILPFAGIKGEITMENGGNVRDAMVKLLSELQQMMLKDSEDDTKSLKVLPQIWSTLLLGKCRHIGIHKRQAMTMRQVKVDLRDDLVKKNKHLAKYIVERAELQHDMRVFSQLYSLRNIHKDIILQLFNLATSTYADVRRSPQEVLFIGFTYFPYAYKFLMPHILEILGRDPEESHEAHKGLLYLLLGPRANALVSTKDWEFLGRIWPALVTCKPSEKMSVIRLRNSLTETIYKSFHSIAIKVNVPESCLEISGELWESSPKPSAAHPTTHEIAEGLEAMQQLERDNMSNYEKLLEDIVTAMEDNCHWRQRSMGMNMLRDLAHSQNNYSPRVINYFLNALLHDSLEERKIAIPTVVTILKQLKREHRKIVIDRPICSADAPPGMRADNLWLQYNYESRPLSESQWNESRYIHEPHVGFNTWPQRLELYAPACDQPSLGPDRILTPSEHIIDTFFTNPEHIDKLIKFNSLEERKGKDKFNEFRFQLYKGLFRNHGDKFLGLFLPHLASLVTQKQESSQLCAAELIAGLIRGSKHWDFSMVSQMWDKLLPIIRMALDNATTETVRDWGVCFGHSVRRRDPNRHHWLLECLMEEPASANATASFLECQKLYILHSALLNQSWRLTELCVRLLDRVEKRLLADPFQNVRDSLGSLLTFIFIADYKRRSPEAERMRPSTREFMSRVLPQLVTLSVADSAELDAKKPEVGLLKTICKWIVTHAFTSDRGILPESTKLLTVLCQLENYEGDDELRLACRRALAGLAQTQALPAAVGDVLDDVEAVFGESSWSAKSSCLSFLEVFVFYNMGVVLSQARWVARIQEVILRMLENERVEVREKARQVLCGLLHCSFLPNTEVLLDHLKLKSKIKIKKPDDLRLRHAGVLGLCAFVQAHPYDVPKYVPSIFEHLSLCLNDPQPIPTTIRKTLGDFKRTHYDGWSSHAESFTDEQLRILQDLNVPPSYYA